MRQLLLGGALAALVVAGLGLWLAGRADAPPPAVAATAGERPAPRTEPAAAAPPPGPGLEVAPGAKRVAPAQPRVSAAPAPAPESPFPALDRLLQLPPAELPEGPQSVGWAGERAPAEPPPKASAPRRLRLDWARENLTQGVPNQPERRRTDVGVSVRVDEADRLRLRGGVRVEEREPSGEEEREEKRTPTVGVEVRF
jgi:hypothetical protein